MDLRIYSYIVCLLGNIKGTFEAYENEFKVRTFNLIIYIECPPKVYTHYFMIAQLMFISVQIYLVEINN